MTPEMAIVISITTDAAATMKNSESGNVSCERL